MSVRNLLTAILVLTAFHFTGCKGSFLDATRGNEGTTNPTDNNPPADDNPPGDDTIPRDGLIGEWLFTGDAKDTSGEGNDGTVNGATIAEDRFGNAGSAYSFDGVDDYIIVSNFFINIGQDYSISIWFKLNDLNGIDQSIFTAISEAYISSGITMVYNSGQASNKKIGVYLGTDGSPGSPWNITENNCGTGSVCTNSYYHLVLIKQNSQYSMILNNSNILYLSNTASFTFNSGMYFGTYTTTLQSFAGIIDDIRIYNRALTEDEISALYSEGETREIYYDTFDGSFNTEYLTYDPAYGQPTVSGGNLVVPSGTSHLYSKKFKIPCVIEGRGHVSDTGTSACHLRFYRIPSGYDATYTTQGFHWLITQWDSIYNHHYYAARAYYLDTVNVGAENFESSFNEDVTIDFTLEVNETVQRLYLNGSLFKEWNTTLNANSWWAIELLNNFANNASELEWLKITTSEWGDFTGLY